MKQRIKSYAIVTKNDDILLCVKESEPKLYGVPHVSIEPGRDPRQMLDDIISKEFDARWNLEDVTSIVDPSRPDIQLILIIYYYDLGSVDFEITDSDYTWFPVNKLQQLSLDFASSQIIKDHFGQHKTDSTALSKKPNIVRTSSTTDVIINCDGGSRGNPGPSAAGFVIYNSENEILFEGGKYLGITTNNQAEYQAVKLGLEKALELGATRVLFRLDSLLIVNQMHGIYKIKNRDLWPIFAHIKGLINELESVKFIHVRREFNKEADYLVNKILDEHKKK